MLVVGAGGLLGTALAAALRAERRNATALTRAELDLRDADAVVAALAAHRAGLVVNAAAYTAVDRAEAEPEAAYAVNRDGAANLARACARIEARLVHVSTDYVFDGRGRKPYDVTDPTGPRTVYGASKLAGERAVATALPDAAWMVRTAWLYAATHPSFVTTMIRLAAEGGTVEVVDDQYGSPTYAGDLAVALLALGDRILAGNVRPGVYHCAGSGAASWWELARATFEGMGADPARVRPTRSDLLSRPAPRPAYSVLSDRSWVQAELPTLPPWRDGLRRALAARSG